MPYLACLVLSQVKLRPSLARQLVASAISGVLAVTPIAIAAPHAAKMGLANLIVMFFAIGVLLLSHVATLLAFRLLDARSTGTEVKPETRLLKTLVTIAGLIIAATFLFVFDQNRPR